MIERQKPLHEAVIERLRDMIIEGEVVVGARLHDANLAAILNVSRTPIREAIKLLQMRGSSNSCRAVGRASPPSRLKA